MNYLGCILFSLFFIGVSAKTVGTGLNRRLAESLTWLQECAPFSYLGIVVIVGCGVVAIWMLMTWPEEEPAALTAYEEIIIRRDDPERGP